MPFGNRYWVSVDQVELFRLGSVGIGYRDSGRQGDLLACPLSGPGQLEIS